jgi:HSP20 family molecular chaperone IbpA
MLSIFAASPSLQVAPAVAVPAVRLAPPAMQLREQPQGTHSWRENSVAPNKPVGNAGLPANAVGAIVPARSAPTVDLSELTTDRDPRFVDAGKSYTLSVQAPGVPADSVVVQILDGQVMVQGVAKKTVRYSSISYALTIPRNADASTAHASCSDGLITVEMDKKLVEEEDTLVHVVAEEFDEYYGPKDDRPYEITLVAVGLAPSDITIRYEPESGELMVSGETEQTGAKIARSFNVPKNVDPEEARASHVDGILCIRIPKKARSVPTRLAVNAPKPKRAAAAAPDDRDPSKNEADAMCKELLREIHPDMGSERSYTADEVAAMLNAVREATAEDVARQPKKGGKKAKAKKEAEW